MSGYIPNSTIQVEEMLKTIGVKSIEDLFSDIPEGIRLKRELNLPKGLSEFETIQKISSYAKQNISCSEAVCFIGAGIYDHIIPSVINHILLRGDFYTAYTPYQAEISQGTLQSIYEYQSLICALTGMDQSNASMYEAGTSLSEAIFMAKSHNNKTKVLISATVHPEYRQVVKTIHNNLSEIIEIDYDDEGATDINKLHNLVKEDVSAVVVQYPNFFGIIEDLEEIGNIAKKSGCIFIVVTNPISLGLLRPPGDFGADIVCGEGQPLGIQMSFGGPSLGFLASKEPFLRKMPGRIAGCTLDLCNNTGYVLTLQTREQHIRREKATSNICTNQALMALAASMYLVTLGENGIKEVANQCFQKTLYLKKEFERNSLISFPFTGAFFNEFVYKIKNAKKILKQLAQNNIFGGLLLEEFYPELKDCVLTAVTEKRSLDEIKLYVKFLESLV